VENKKVGFNGCSSDEELYQWTCWSIENL